MEQHPIPHRRRLLAGLATLAAAAPALALGKSQPPKAAANTAPGGGLLLATDFGVVANSPDDQSKLLQAALDAAHQQGRPLLLPGGQIFVQNLEIPGKLGVVGQPGMTMLMSWLGNPIGKAESADDLSLEGVGFVGAPSEAGNDLALLLISDSAGVRIANCQFLLSKSTGLELQNSAAVVADCTFDDLDTALFANNSRGLTVSRNQIGKCGNGGILIWRDEAGPDGSIVSGNHIAHVLATAGGSGQHGNGINVFRADDVIVSDNVIDDCAFSSVRANATRNCQIRGNTCTNGREVAIYSEFGFSGSVVANNIIDGATSGISITNLDNGGRLAVCTGNIVRNLDATAAKPYGIYAEADTTIVGNTVSDFAGFGIVAGYGPFLRNVLISGNVVSAVETGIAASIVDKAGTVRIAGNLVSGATAAFAGMAWDKLMSTDLVADAAKYPNVVIEGNTVAG